MTVDFVTVLLGVLLAATVAASVEYYRQIRKAQKEYEKANLRLTKAKISRGSFNRTLKQSKENVIKSIYTVLLLGYLGVFESTTLDPYLEIANKLHQYMEAHQDMPIKGEELKDHLKVIEIIRQELETSLKRLSSPSADVV